MIPRARYQHHLLGKATAGCVSAQEASATLQTACMAVLSRNEQRREHGTTAPSVPAAGRETPKSAGKGEGNGIAGLAASAPYVLPAPTWSLSDLNVATDDEEAVDSARAALSPEEVQNKPRRSCAMYQAV